VQAYGELCAQFYDLDKPAAPPEVLAWLQSQLPAAPARCLAAMCGSGRFLVPMLRAGLVVDGVDASAAMLRSCADRVGQEHAPKVLLRHGRMEDFTPPTDYHACFFAGGALSLLEDPVMVLAGLRAAMVPGGLLLFEFYPPAEAAPTGSTLRVHARKDGARIRLHATARYDSRAQLETHTCRYELIQADKVAQAEDEILRVRLYTLGQATSLAASAGFKPEVSHGPHGWWVRATG